ncbi:MAG: response regulator [Bryobacterales bacterium]|nr:response regulator [Bryobacterales bacterium]
MQGLVCPAFDDGSPTTVFRGISTSQGIHNRVEHTLDSTAPSSASPLILAVLEDLFFGIKISEAAKRAGARMVIAKTPDAFWTRVEDAPSLIVLDLNCASMEPLALLAKLRDNPAFKEIPTLGYLPHVQEELRRQAIDAGCGRVLPRSAFSSQVDALIREAVAPVVS